MDKPLANIPLEQLVGAQIKALRLALGMTGADLAGAANLSPGMLSKIENGQVVGRLSMTVPGPMTETLPRRNWFPM